MQCGINPEIMVTGDQRGGGSGGNRGGGGCVQGYQEKLWGLQFNLSYQFSPSRVGGGGGG